MNVILLSNLFTLLVFAFSNLFEISVNIEYSLQNIYFRGITQPNDFYGMTVLLDVQRFILIYFINRNCSKNEWKSSNDFLSQFSSLVPLHPFSAFHWSIMTNELMFQWFQWFQWFQPKRLEATLKTNIIYLCSFHMRILRHPGCDFGMKKFL